MKKYKLFSRENGYKCHINNKELNFLFGINENITDINMINLELAIVGYYITL